MSTMKVFVVQEAKAYEHCQTIAVYSNRSHAEEHARRAGSEVEVVEHELLQDLPAVLKLDPQMYPFAVMENEDTPRREWCAYEAGATDPGQAEHFTLSKKVQRAQRAPVDPTPIFWPRTFTWYGWAPSKAEAKKRAAERLDQELAKEKTSVEG